MKASLATRFAQQKEVAHALEIANEGKSAKTPATLVGFVLAFIILIGDAAHAVGIRRRTLLRLKRVRLAYAGRKSAPAST